jgi:tetratricopeptide (TPR) repeat protein
MTLIDNPLVRAILFISIASVALGLVGNLAPEDVAKVAGRLQFLLLIAGPGILLFACLKLRGKPLPDQPRPPSTGLSINLGGIARAGLFAAIAFALAIACIFAVAGLAQIIGEPGSSDYPATATRVLIISIIGVPFVAFGGLLVWRRLGPRKHFYQGAAKLAAGQYEAALAHFEIGKSTHPDDPAIWEESALCLLWLGRAEEALTSADHALSLARRWQGLYARGVALMRLGATAEARQDLEECALIKGGVLVDLFIATVLVDLRLLDSAIAVLKAVRKRIKLIDASLMLGEAYRLSHLEGEATRAYTDTAALAGRMNHVAATPIYAYALAQLGRYDDAIQLADTVLEGPVFRDLALRTRAIATMRLDDLATTESTLRQLIETSPHAAVQTLTDPYFTHLLSKEAFRTLLGEALAARDEIIGRVGARNA